MTTVFDAAIIGAGAAGMMAAAVAGQRGVRVALLDHAEKLGEKIRISGGGRCNFTNIGATPAHFISRNPHFCRSALAGYTPRDFLDLVERHGIGWHEKHKGQLFCDDSSASIIAMLKSECDAAGVSWRMGCPVSALSRQGPEYRLQTARGEIRARQVVIATGGMAMPQLLATDFALRIARQFGLTVVEPRPALVPLIFDSAQWEPFSRLSGVALEVTVRTGAGKAGGEFLEDLLFTHRGLSGPAILQISSYWNPGQAIVLDMAPGTDLGRAWIDAKRGSRHTLEAALADAWPRRLAEQWLASRAADARFDGGQRLADVPDRILRRLAEGIHGWSLQPTGTAGYKKAEVMRGGVDTRAIDQKSMQAKDVPGLYFIGEALDVTGWLGGYNFQWAWASGFACGRSLRRA